jgi:hypothetical protein
MPSPASDQGAPYLQRLAPADYLGKKGRSLPGSHRPRGLMVAAGPSIKARGQIEIDIEGSSALVLARIGAAPPLGARGQYPAGLVSGHGAATLPELPVARAASSNIAALEARLRALGYVD